MAIAPTRLTTFCRPTPRNICASSSRKSTGGQPRVRLAAPLEARSQSVGSTPRRSSTLRKSRMEPYDRGR
eukprot:scaffold46961_cov81-Phaeocystis_antarctica.AAC.7